ncbi:HpcH/HpaI aldolase/citrate lyase family protein [Noviherbaspirillum galbum]|uniref:CoA ester lyase n=1 Tax=Noviherbaspirillum galbum TaxID=2709383 RepID=A0A6B3SIN7_9BURK|nr:CoA ester lyase [Noviherbaspirillum galbum]NEX60458.1 CoA ester lyase [Noviherbaspirillum galbum]
MADLADLAKITARSYLFVPASRPERFERACAAGADAVIVDLEDAVPPAGKTAARDALRAWLSPRHEVLVRINAADTEWFENDLALCGMPGVAGVVLPKADSADVIGRVAAAGCRRIYPLMESGAGFARLQEVAAASGVRRLMFGSIDLKLDLGIEGDDEELAFFRSQLVLASRLAGLAPPVDGVCTAIDAEEEVRRDTLRARRFGFGGKLCIHPRQIGAVHAGFAPTAEEAAWAVRVLQAARDAQGAAVALDGKMIDRPVILRAERIAAMAARDAAGGKAGDAT